MSVDFSFDVFKKFIVTLKETNYNIIPVNEYFTKKSSPRTILLRHDVDKMPQNSLAFAKFEKELGLKGTYYFRINQNSFDEEVIKSILDMGHEIGYHYEDIDTIIKTSGRQLNDVRSNPDKYFETLASLGIESFARNLEKFRSLASVNTICMHGTPLSKVDGRLLWKYFDYKKFDILIEPYFDIIFDNDLYLTDTGRMWNGQLYSIRDKPNKILKNEDFEKWATRPQKGSLMNMTNSGEAIQKEDEFHSTFDIIKVIQEKKSINIRMINFHPQRWNNNVFKWTKELFFQNIKNSLKLLLFK